MLPCLPLLALLLGGCSTAARYPTLQRNLGFEHDGVQRAYHFYQAEVAGALPLVVLLHGGHATIDAFIGETSGGAAPVAGVFLDLARQEGFHVLIPQGLDKHWNDCRTDCSTCPDSDDASFLLGLIDHATSTVDVDPDRVHMVGESNGGMMTERMAVEHGQHLASVGVIIAAEPANNECGPRDADLSLAFVVGTEDKAIPWDGGVGSSATGALVSADDTMALWVDHLGCDAEASSEGLPDLDPDDQSTVLKQRWTCPQGRSLLRYRVDGGGHVVPSIAEPVSRVWELLVGEQNHDLESAQALWAFFEAHPRVAGEP